jgi:hypothetical protein
MCLLTDDNNDNPIIIRPHIVLTDEDNDNPIKIRPHNVFTDRRQRRIMIWFIIVVVRQ